MRPTTYPTGISSQTRPPPPQYFDETKKKGEVNELKQLLKNTLSEKDATKRREVVKKVIAFMTLGIDVSRLFSEMCMASYTTDLIQKKMIYLYLGNYAESNSELAFMAINTYLKDLDNADGKIRGLALRSLFNLRFQGVLEYLPSALVKGLNDLDPYVKKTAIMACVKYFYLTGAKIDAMNNNIDILYSLIRDPDPVVSANSIMALDEILQEEGGIAINSKMIIYLLNRIKEYNEYGQSVILELVAKYKPRTEAELLDIMNVLDERLKHSSSSIVLGCVKIFLNFTKDNPTIHKQVYERIQSPLITLMTSGEVTGSYELAYIVLSHIQFIVSRGGNEYFEREYKHFYCRTDEPSYIRHLKLEILKWIASEQTLGDIMNELGEYVTDVDSETARKSIQALGGIALRIPKMASAIVKQLCSFLNYNQSHIVNETMIVFQDILRKHRDEHKEIIQIIKSSTEYITEPDAKVAFIWILGEFGEYIDDAPYILEHLINNIKDSSESVKVKKILLTSSVRLFLSRPPEMIENLRNVINQIVTNENEDFDLKDRALFYCKALQYDLKELKKTLEQNVSQEEMFVEDEEMIKEGATLEFNTLSVIFRKPASKFIKSLADMNMMKSKEQEEIAAQQEQAQAQNQINEASTQDAKNEYGTGTNTGNEVYNNNLLDLDSTNQSTSGEMQGATITTESLSPPFEIDASIFQEKWTQLNESAKAIRILENVEAINVENMEQALASKNIHCIASGERDGELRFYFYTKHLASDSMLFVEIIINRMRREMSLSVKSDIDDLGPYFSKYIEECFRGWQLLA